MTTVLPSPVTYGHVIGKITVAVPDSADADTYPDGVPASGQVTFTPSVQNGRLLSSTTTPPTTFLLAPIAVALEADGSFAVDLIATDNTSLNPVDWTWGVSFQLDGGYTIPAFAFALPGGTTVDLTEVTPVAMSNGVPVIPGLPGPANTLAIGTVSTLPAGSSATATITGSSPNQTLNLGIPTGSTGPAGGVNTVTAADTTITVGGTTADPTVAANVGTTTGTVAAGDDSRFAGSPAGTAGAALSATDASVTNSRTPTGTAGGDLTGTYPNPTLVATGTPGTYASPTSITTDAQGRVTSVTAGGSPTWTTPTITNGGTPAGYQAVRYTKDAAGFTVIEGAIQPSTSIATNTTLFTLPAGMRPAATIISALANANNSTVIVDSSGNVKANSSLSSGLTYGLNVRFHAEA